MVFFIARIHQTMNANVGKPKAGLIDAIAAELDITPAGGIMVGDSLRDLEAGVARQCTPVLVKTGKGLRTLDKIAEDKQWASLAIFDDLAAVVDQLLATV